MATKFAIVPNCGVQSVIPSGFDTYCCSSMRNWGFKTSEEQQFRVWVSCFILNCTLQFTNGSQVRWCFQTLALYPAISMHIRRHFSHATSSIYTTEFAVESIYPYRIHTMVRYVAGQGTGKRCIHELGMSPRNILLRRLILSVQCTSWYIFVKYWGYNR